MLIWDNKLLKARLQNETSNIKASLASKDFREFLADWLNLISDLLLQYELRNPSRPETTKISFVSSISVKSSKKSKEIGRNIAI